MKGREKEQITKPPVAIRSQAKLGPGRDWSGFDEFRRQHPTAAGGETWESYEANLAKATNLNAAQETIRYAMLDRMAAIGR